MFYNNFSFKKIVCFSVFIINFFCKTIGFHVLYATYKKKKSRESQKVLINLITSTVAAAALAIFFKNREICYQKHKKEMYNLQNMFCIVLADYSFCISRNI